VLDAFLELAYRLDVGVDVGRHWCLCASGRRLRQAFGGKGVFGSVFVLHGASPSVVLDIQNLGAGIEAG
jgi:hypothetical protein